jgi:DNA-binding NarL/FixJ family response regulator
MTATRKKILVADDNGMIRAGIASILAQRDDWHVFAQAVDGKEAVEIAAMNCPDVAILDITMPRMNGIDAARELMKYCPNVVIVSQSFHGYAQIVDELKRIGVMGFVHKLKLGTELIPTVEAVLQGQSRYVLES